MGPITKITLSHHSKEMLYSLIPITIRRKDIHVHVKGPKVSTIERYHGVEAVWVECRSVSCVCSGSVVAVHVNSVYRKSNVCCTAMASKAQ